MTEEMVAVDCPSGCRGCDCRCGKSRAVKKSWAVKHDKAFKLLSSQPLTLAERRELKRDREEIETRKSAILKLAGARDWSENRGIGGSKVHLSAKERKSLERFIGCPVDDAQHARRLMKEKGLRFIEKGEFHDTETEALVRWAESGGEARGEVPPEILQRFPGWDMLAEGRKREWSFDHAKELARAESEYRERVGG